MRTALVQMTSGDDPARNLRQMADLVTDAARDGAGFALTPEVCNCVSSSRSHQAEVLRPEDQDVFLAGARDLAARLGIWLLLGSIAVKSDPPEPRFANRSFLLGPDGGIVARYDKAHMFDVQVTEAETYRESEGYAPGDRLVLARTPFATLGLSVCYDLRFPYMFRAMAQAGAQVLTVPAAFSPATGPRHWAPLLTARAIENGAYVLAPAQRGQHPVSRGRPRQTHGHSMAISPWGEVLADAGDSPPGIHMVTLDMAQVAQARQKVPSLTHDRDLAP